MSKKIIQLSTNQCPPCQMYKRQIENIIDKTPYEYEYVSLYKGEEPITNDNLEEYWEEVKATADEYKKQYNVPFYGLPTFVLKEDDKITIINKSHIIKFLEDASK